MAAVKETLYQSELPWVMNDSKFTRTFGGRPTPHEQAIEQTVAWFPVGLAGITLTAVPIHHRREAIRKAAGAMGIKFTAYLTLGRYDYVAIVDAPNDEAIAQFALATGMQGNLSTETLRAFSKTETEKLVSGLP